MSITEKANELGKAITEDPRFVAYEAAKDIQENDEELQKMLLGYETQRNKVIQANQENAPEEEIRKYSDELQSMYETIMKADSMANFVKARQEIEKILSEVNSIIDFYVTGEEPSNCGGDCCSCGGCH